MDEREALHTAARRYAMERRKVAILAHLRDDILPGILRRIEAVTPSSFSSVEALREFLLGALRTGSLRNDTSSPSFASYPNLEDSQQEAEERFHFVAYIESLTVDDLRMVAPLPHRRVLGEQQADKLWRRMRRVVPYHILDTLFG